VSLLTPSCHGPHALPGVRFGFRCCALQRSHLYLRHVVPNGVLCGPGLTYCGWHCSKGISSSALPYKRTPPSWLKATPEEVEDNVCKLAKKGLTPSQIGVYLRDSSGVAQVWCGACFRCRWRLSDPLTLRAGQERDGQQDLAFAEAQRFGAVLA
jgi:hypothetical protein